VEVVWPLVLFAKVCYSNLVLDMYDVVLLSANIIGVFFAYTHQEVKSLGTKTIECFGPCSIKR
jgi:hypothetical protein